MNSVYDLEGLSFTAMWPAFFSRTLLGRTAGANETFGTLTAIGVPHPCGLCKGGAVRKVLESAAVECDDHEGSISSSTIPFFQ